MPTLRPKSSRNAHAMHLLKGLEEFGNPLRFPIRKLLFRDCVPELARDRCSMLNIQKNDGRDRVSHNIITSAFSLVDSSSKKSFSPFSIRASTT